MKKRKLLVLMLLLFVIQLSFLKAQGAFDGYMKPQGNTDLVLSYTHEAYDTYKFGSEAQSINNTTYTGSLFVAMGLKGDRNLILSIPYLSLNQEESGLQDAILGFKKLAKRQYKGDWTISRIGAVGISFPVSNYSTTVNNPIGQKAVSVQPRGIIQFDHKTGGFFMAQAGADVRFFPDFQVGTALISKVGFAASKIYFDLWVDYFHTFEQGIDLSVGAGQGSSWLKAGFNLYAPMAKGFGLIAGGGNYFYGRNIGLAWHLKGGLVYSFTKKGGS
jgi:hypothetical protein